MQAIPASGTLIRVQNWFKYYPWRESCGARILATIGSYFYVAHSV
jgi:hypothetical protein